MAEISYFSMQTVQFIFDEKNIIFVCIHRVYLSGHAASWIENFHNLRIIYTVFLNKSELLIPLNQL